MVNMDGAAYLKLAAAGVLSLLMVSYAFGDGSKELSQKTADPTGDLALVFTQFTLTFNDGDLNTGDPKVAGRTVFQPIIPIPLYGAGDDEWRIVSRPTISLEAEFPIPQGEVDNFDRDTGLSDLNIPLPALSPGQSPGSGSWRWGRISACP